MENTNIDQINENQIVEEIFKPIAGFANYEVSNYGNVKFTGNDKTIILRRFKSGLYYAVDLYDCNNKLTQIHVHKLVCQAFLSNPENKKCVNFIDKNKLNCSLTNLRYATHKENQYNQSMSKRNTSGVKGVTWASKYNKWRSQIKFNKKSMIIGYFDDIEDAKKARQNKAKEVFGEFINKCEL